LEISIILSTDSRIGYEGERGGRRTDKSVKRVLYSMYSMYTVLLYSILGKFDVLYVRVQVQISHPIHTLLLLGYL
jgi:hypothetical protein